MIYLITGTPGAGKTLYTIDQVVKRNKTENRQVFQYGLKGLSDSLSWQALDKPEDWTDCPDGSIIIIDEAQQLYRPAGRTTVKPRFVTDLETHRHRGLDIYWTTQEAGLIDSHPRKLVGTHVHLVRVAGLNGAKRMIAEGEIVDPKRPAPTVSVDRYSYNKDIFGLYKSAEVHTHKKHIPPHFRKLVWLVPLLVFLVWYAYHVMTNLGSDKDQVAADSLTQHIPDSTGFGTLPSKSQAFSMPNDLNVCDRFYVSVDLGDRLLLTCEYSINEDSVSSFDYSREELQLLYSLSLNRIGFRRYALSDDSGFIKLL